MRPSSADRQIHEAFQPVLRLFRHFKIAFEQAHEGDLSVGIPGFVQGHWPHPRGADPSGAVMHETFDNRRRGTGQDVASAAFAVFYVMFGGVPQAGNLPPSVDEAGGFSLESDFQIRPGCFHVEESVLRIGDVEHAVGAAERRPRLAARLRTFDADGPVHPHQEIHLFLDQTGAISFRSQSHGGRYAIDDRIYSAFTMEQILY